MLQLIFSKMTAFLFLLLLCILSLPGRAEEKISNPELLVDKILFVSIKYKDNENKALSEKNNQKETVSLLHCVTSYPAPEEDYNLKVLENLKNQFEVKVGVSDHSLNPIIVPLGGYLTGGEIIEKHITLSNETEGLDDPVALNPENFKKMVETLRSFEGESKEKILEYLETNFGKEKIALVLGTGEKKLATYLVYSKSNVAK